MRLPLRSLLLVLLAALPFVAGAQKYYQHDTTVKVYANSRLQTLAWCAGFNNPQFAMADLNHDGLTDLVIFEPWNSLRTFLNMGTATVPDYRYAPEFEVNFPPLVDYMVLADYNCDGIPDLFHQGVYGFAVYRGYWNIYGQLAFAFYRNLYFDNDGYSPGIVNAFNNPGDIPSIVDVDGDGDLDFVAYDINGGTMNLYKNMRVEKDLPCDSIYIDLADRCWGRVYQGYYRSHTIPYVCDNSHLRLPKSGNKKTHSGNTPCLFDWDMDGDYDYLDGSVSFNEMTFLKNGRKEFNPGGADSMISQDTMWQSFSGGRRIDLPTWPAAFNVDIDQDGKKDLLIAPNATSGAENYNCIWYYKNYSTPGMPDWRFQSDSFLTDRSIDLGTGSYPVLYDVNKDGKPDLIVGSDGYYQRSTGTLRARLSCYLNTSTTGNPSFTLLTKDFLGLDSFNFKGAAPAFGDIDADTVADMIVGHTDGRLSYFKNMAASDTAAPNWQLQQLVLTDEDSNVINVGGRAAPFIYDMDHDGKKDLIIGNVYGKLVYYQNVSTTPGIMKLRLISTHLGHIQADPNNTYGIYSVPFIGRIDSTATEYLVLGSNSGNVYVFTGFQTGDTAATYTMVSGHYAYIDSFYSIYNNHGTAYAFYGGLRSAVTVGDIAGDGALRMIVGNNKGGLEIYKARVYVPFPVNHVGVAEMNEEGNVKIFPNPANDMLNITWAGMTQPDVQISFINMAGQTLYTSAAPALAGHAVLPVSMLPSGMYVCILQSGVSRYYSKFTVVR